LAGLTEATVSGVNVMEPLIEAARLGATIGEISGVFSDIYGQYREPAPW
jgi:methylmalonyl-CoA mutase N-terminal domain/subunit